MGMVTSLFQNLSKTSSTSRTAGPTITMSLSRKFDVSAASK